MPSDVLGNTCTCHYGVSVTVENENHCDFVKLREMLIRVNMEDLREQTHTRHYELYRRCKLEEMGFKDTDPDSKPFRLTWISFLSSCFLPTPACFYSAFLCFHLSLEPFILLLYCTSLSLCLYSVIWCLVNCIVYCNASYSFLFPFSFSSVSLQETYEAKRNEFMGELQKKEEEMRQMFVQRVKEKEAELKEAEKEV